MGADETINYVDTPNWEKAFWTFTDGEGVDQIVEVGGAGTLQKSIDAVGFGGHIGLIGVLTQGEINFLPLLGKSISQINRYLCRKPRDVPQHERSDLRQCVETRDRPDVLFGDARAVFNAMGEDQHLARS